MDHRNPRCAWVRSAAEGYFALNFFPLFRSKLGQMSSLLTPYTIVMWCLLVSVAPERARHRYCNPYPHDGVSYYLPARVAVFRKILIQGSHAHYSEFLYE